MAVNLWTAPTQQLLVGTSVTQNTFTAAKDIPVGETAAAFPIVFGGTLVPGSTVHVRAWGSVACTGTPTIVLGVYYGLVAGTALAVCTAKTLASGLAASAWVIDWCGRVVTNGSAGSLIGAGSLLLPTAATTYATPTPFPESTPAAVGSLDMTVNKQLSIGATWSASNIANAVFCHGMEVLISG